MPGLVGIFTKKSRESAEAELRRMVASMQHEDWYVSGTWFDEVMGLYLGWVERSEHGTSKTHLQEENSDLILAFSGEEFSASEESEDVAKPLHLLRMAEQDPRFPKSLNGTFHGVLIDKKSRTATLFNDRYGMHRIYFHEARDAFYFAAEAKAILAVKPSVEINRSTRPGRICLLRVCSGESNNLQGHSNIASCVCLGCQEFSDRQEELVF